MKNRQGIGRILAPVESTARLFDGLLGAGREIAGRASDSGQSRFEQVQSAVRDSFHKAREQAESGVEAVAETLGVDQAFENRVVDVLQNLGYPDKKRVDALHRKINRLQKKLEENNAALEEIRAANDQS